MLYTSEQLERQAVLEAAARIVAAARTAPKTKGVDQIRACVLTDEDKNRLADRMDELSGPLDYAFFARDAGNLRAADAVVLIGVEENRCGLDKGCAYCHFDGCAACAEKGGLCAFNAIDVGIAVGSAVSMAADLRVDSRVMFSIGRAAMTLNLPVQGATVVLGIPLSVTGKSPFFDRKKKS